MQFDEAPADLCWSCLDERENQNLWWMWHKLRGP